MRSLAEIGFEAEADAFRRFIQRSTAGHVEDLQILYGVGGERRIGEQDIPELEGYRGAPVRVGNAAIAQTQTQAKTFWSVRENQSGAQKREGAAWKHDVSVPVSKIADFIEGIRAAIIDKDRKPRWRPETIEAVTPDIVDRHFRSVGKLELTFE